MNKNGPQIIQKPSVSQEGQPSPTLNLHEDLLRELSFLRLLALQQTKSEGPRGRSSETGN